jgi:tRNA(His) 5'-end guanylyltransferase
MLSLRERMEEYEIFGDSKLTRRLPIIIKSSIRNYKKIIQNMEQPYSFEFIKLLSQSTFYTLSDIPDAIFAYLFNDEIIIILRNDLDNQEPWCNNCYQTISSTISSLLSVGFLKVSYAEDFLTNGDLVFKSKAFILPSLAEAVNYLIWKQSNCIKNSINDIVNYELINKLGKHKVNEIIINSSFEEKIDLLFEYCDINFRDNYPSSFLNGVGLYKIPTILNTADGLINKKKWFIDYDMPEFIKRKDFILNIIKNGSDIYRSPDIKNLMGE